MLEKYMKILAFHYEEKYDIEEYKQPKDDI